MPKKLEVASLRSRIVKPLSNRAVSMVHLRGLLPFQSQILDSICTNRPFVMLCVCSMDGPSAAFHLTVCGAPFSIDHAFTCLKGAFPIIRHNKIRDLLADLLTEVCPCVAVEPVFQPLSGKQFQLHSTKVEDNARLNVSAQEFWDKRRTTAIFDVKVFNAHAPSNFTSSIATLH